MEEKLFQHWLEECPVKYEKLEGDYTFMFNVRDEDYEYDDSSVEGVANCYEGYEGIALN